MGDRMHGPRSEARRRPRGEVRALILDSPPMGKGHEPPRVGRGWEPGSSRQDGCVASWISAFLLIGYLCAGKPLELPFLSMSLRHQPVANAPSSGGHVMRHGVGVVSGAFTGTQRPSPRGQAGAEGTSDGCGRNKTWPRSGPFVDRIRAPVFFARAGFAERTRSVSTSDVSRLGQQGNHPVTSSSPPCERDLIAVSKLPRPRP